MTLVDCITQQMGYPVPTFTAQQSRRGNQFKGIIGMFMSERRKLL